MGVISATLQPQPKLLIYWISLSIVGWKTIYSPALMTFLLLKVSGVALLEKGLKKTKPGYEAYIAATSSFFPWFPAAKKD
jgi:steroid 5-alpha reductase family enzyme